jgi:hypothetical protein
MVARVVGARAQVGRPAAAAEVRDDAAPSPRREMLHQQQRVVRTRAPFEAMEQHDERGIGGNARRVDEPVEIPEVAVVRIDALAPVFDAGAGQEMRVDRLRVPARQPARTAERSDAAVGGAVGHRVVICVSAERARRRHARASS